MAKVEIIDKSSKTKCWSCEGKGCEACNNTGFWKEPNYFIIYTDKNGVKQAFQSDFVK